MDGFLLFRAMPRGREPPMFREYKRQKGEKASAEAGFSGIVHKNV